MLGLLRGGVPVAAPVAARLGAALGALAVRKLGIPDEPEVAFGAVASYRRQHVVHHVPRIHEYAVSRYSPAALAAVERRANAKLLRLAAAFDAFAPDCAGRTVVLCDDGLATGATMTAALRVVSLLEPANLVVAVPVSPAKVLRELSAYADAVVCFLPRRIFRRWAPTTRTFHKSPSRRSSGCSRNSAPRSSRRARPRHVACPAHCFGTGTGVGCCRWLPPANRPHRHRDGRASDRRSRSWASSAG